MKGAVIAFPGLRDDPWAKAEKKADDLHMTLDGNPLREYYSDCRRGGLTCKNMDKLEEDARAWNNQRTGEAYRAIRGLVYKGD